MVEGFAGFGFPKAHSAAFGLLAYQSTWLRVHYGAEFLCALLNEQPMGFYAPDSLVHEAESRGIAVLGLDVNASAGAVHGRAMGVCAWGWATSRTCAEAEMHGLVAERERSGPFTQPRRARRARRRAGADARTARLVGRLRSPARRACRARWGSASATGARRCGSWGWPRQPRRSDTPGLATALRSGAGEHAAGAAPGAAGAAARCAALGRWQRLIADYSTSGVTIGEHALAILRARLTVPMLATSAQLPRLPQRLRRWRSRGW